MRSRTSLPRGALPLTALTAIGAIGVIAAAGLAACGPTGAPDPFAFDAGFIPGAGGGGGSGGDSSASTGPGPGDPEIGGPCVDDGQCDDGIECTFDACDKALLRCRFTPDDSTCQNAFYCDGVERCSTKLGCTVGEPVGCSDPSPCTVDVCDEETDTCKQSPRDADFDGDPDGHCPNGHDCDDADPSVSSLAPEICQNLKDDNCDGIKDEASCQAPKHDTCADPLEIGAPGSYGMDTTGAAFHYATTCSTGDPSLLRDVVAAVLLPSGPPVDVEISARATFSDVAVTLAGQCGDPATEIACGKSFPSIQGGNIAKLRGRALGDPAKGTALPVYITTSKASPVTLEVALLPPEPVPTNETCGTASPITPSVPITAQILDAAEDIASACATPLGELVYAFELTQAQNVDVYAASLDGDALPSISLRGPGCALPEDEITCQSATNAHVFWQSLEPGTYYVAVSATAPTTALVTLELSPPTMPAPDDTCATAPPIPPNVTIDVTLAGHQDDVNTGCFPGAADAAFSLDLAEASDVLLVQRISQGDVAAIELALPACDVASDQIICTSGASSPNRAAKRNVPPGSYRVVAESIQSQPMQLTALVRPAVPPTLVPFADSCDDALEIPPEGGFFQGNTANASADYSAGCDQGGVNGYGSPDQILKLVLPSKKRVFFDMGGSAFTTLLDVRKGPDCPGTEMAQACGVGFAQSRSFLDLTLDPGIYFVQIDGYALAKGPWFLDVRVVPP